MLGCEFSHGFEVYLLTCGRHIKKEFFCKRTIQDIGKDLSILQVDGGASANGLLMQMQADISGTDVIRPACLETTAWGAASLAGLAADVWRNREELKELRLIDSVFRCTWTPERREAGIKGWCRAVSCVQGWLSV